MSDKGNKVFDYDYEIKNSTDNVTEGTTEASAEVVESAAEANDAASEKAQAKKSLSAKKKVIIAVIAAAVVAFALLYVFVINKSIKYNKAVKLLKNKEYEKAYELFASLGDYKDSREKCEHFFIAPLKYVGTDVFGARRVEEKKFDKEGHILLETSTYEDGSQGKIEYEYNEAGWLITKTEYVVYEEEPSAKYEYEYDENGLKIQEKYGFANTEEQTIVTYKYNAEGLLESELFHFEDVEIEDRYEYDSKKRIIKRAHFRNSKSRGLETYTYDEYDNVILYESFGIDGDKTDSQEYKYTYDSKGNILKEICTYENGLLYVYEYTYDDWNNRIKQVFKDNDGTKTNRKFKYEYDEGGKVIWYSDGDAKWELEDYTYFYSEDKETLDRFNYWYIMQ